MRSHILLVSLLCGGCRWLTPDSDCGFAGCGPHTPHIEDTGDSVFHSVGDAVDPDRQARSDAPFLAVRDGLDPGMIRVFRSLDDGTFAAPEVFPSGFAEVHLMVIGDFDGDGAAELIGREVGSETGRRWARDERGEFALAPVPHLDFNIKGADDIDGDGNLDLFGWSSEGGIGYTALGDGTGDFEVLIDSFNLRATWTGYHQRVPRRLTDLDGDGRRDLILAEYATAGAGQSGLHWYPGRGDGTFGSPIALGTVPGPVNGMDLGDLTGDGRPDLVVGLDDDGDPGQIWRLDGQAGGFAEPVELVDAFEENESGSDDMGYGTLGLYDWDRDGVPDLVVRTHTDAMGKPVFDRWLGDGSGGVGWRARLERDPAGGTSFAAP